MNSPVGSSYRYCTASKITLLVIKTIWNDMLVVIYIRVNEARHNTQILNSLEIRSIIAIATHYSKCAYEFSYN